MPSGRRPGADGWGPGAGRWGTGAEGGRPVADAARSGADGPPSGADRGRTGADGSGPGLSGRIHGPSIKNRDWRAWEGGEDKVNVKVNVKKGRGGGADNVNAVLSGAERTKAGSHAAVRSMQQTSFVNVKKGRGVEGADKVNAALSGAERTKAGGQAVRQRLIHTHLGPEHANGPGAPPPSPPPRVGADSSGSPFGAARGAVRA